MNREERSMLQSFPGLEHAVYLLLSWTQLRRRQLSVYSCRKETGTTTGPLSLSALLPPSVSQDGVPPSFSSFTIGITRR